MKAYDHLYLSPHYDDTALSCGGMAHQQAQAGGAVASITICAAPPPHHHFSAYAETMHRGWGNLGNIIATRRLEDQAAMAALGIEAVYLDFTDCIYRGDPAAGCWFYNSDPDIFGDLHPDDLPLAEEIAAAVAQLIRPGAEPTLYAPLTVGNHVDHQLVHHAGWILQRLGFRVLFYEEFPYVDARYPYAHRPDDHNPYTLQVALVRPQNAGLKPKLIALSDQALAAKVDGIRAYASQLNTLFGGASAMADYARSYAFRLGGAAPAERLWMP